VQKEKFQRANAARRGRSAKPAPHPALQNHIAPHATGSTLIECGSTRVICAVTVEKRAALDEGTKVSGGWLTAEYSMLPYSPWNANRATSQKENSMDVHPKYKIIAAQSPAIDLEKVGARTICVDCDVLQAMRNANRRITGAFVALSLAVKKMLHEKKLTEIQS